MSSTEVRVTQRPRSKPRWWAELPLIALVYAAYSGGRLLVAGDTTEAVRHAESIIRLERILHLDPEHALNSVLTHVSWLGVPACFAYATLHYLVTPGVLVWLWKRHPGRYLFMRTWLMLSTFIGLIGFTLLPTAPPRLLPAALGFHDTMAQYATFGWWGADASAPQGMGQLTNQYAAMPSLHVGWALWCGIMLWRHSRNPLARALGVAYPIVIALVVLGTANHYLMDVIAGVAVMGLGLLLTRPVRRLVALAGGLLTARPAAAAPEPAAPEPVGAPVASAPLTLALNGTESVVVDPLVHPLTVESVTAVPRSVPGPRRDTDTRRPAEAVPPSRR
ncbi:phosphatase PAP2 family protein [Streptantibioticus silvisoli]|uniref:Phosphatase PAP2 family protein n=1 Tax=Streptantibioticus silvisoli TaxID=2705255 RepID=A0ABT6W8W0_9ACTN|nr:phosphatase PAP2 family protein [Streptantibioticus silvisoli]MDI5967200.1 phosphatase PAP2 family protein [Streptantibioticus silvisoli]